MKNSLMIMTKPSGYVGRRCFAYYLVVNISGKTHFFVDTNKAELKRVWNSIKSECIGLCSLDWLWLNDGKSKKSEMTNKGFNEANFSDPKNILNWNV